MYFHINLKIDRSTNLRNDLTQKIITMVIVVMIMMVITWIVMIIVIAILCCHHYHQYCHLIIYDCNGYNTITSRVILMPRMTINDNIKFTQKSRR